MQNVAAPEVENIEQRKLWIVAFPAHQYVENITQLARQYNVRIIDKKFATEEHKKLEAKDLPKLTLKSAVAAVAPDPDATGVEIDEAAQSLARISAMVEGFVEADTATKPNVGDAEAAFEINTNGKEVSEAWTQYQALKAE